MTTPASALFVGLAVLVALTRPSLATPGWSCRSYKNCNWDSTFPEACLGGRCCDYGKNKDCVACDARGNCATCSPGAVKNHDGTRCGQAPGTKCDWRTNCANLSCEEGYCCDRYIGDRVTSKCTKCAPGTGKCSACESGYYLNPAGLCAKPLKDGEACVADDNCQSDNCAKGVCCISNCEDCGSTSSKSHTCKKCVDGYGFYSSRRTVCSRGADIGARCSYNTMCAGDKCLKGRCCDRDLATYKCKACSATGRCSECEPGYVLDVTSTRTTCDRIPPPVPVQYELEQDSDTLVEIIGLSLAAAGVIGAVVLLAVTKSAWLSFTSGGAWLFVIGLGMLTMGVWPRLLNMDENKYSYSVTTKDLFRFRNEDYWFAGTSIITGSLILTIGSITTFIGWQLRNPEGEYDKELVSRAEAVMRGGKETDLIEDDARRPSDSAKADVELEIPKASATTM